MNAEKKDDLEGESRTFRIAISKDTDFETYSRAVCGAVEEKAQGIASNQFPYLLKLWKRRGHGGVSALPPYGVGVTIVVLRKELLHPQCLKDLGYNNVKNK